MHSKLRITRYHFFTFIFSPNFLNVLKLDNFQNIAEMRKRKRKAHEALRG